MTIDNLINFYASCLSLGFVKVMHDDKSNGAVVIYAPSKNTTNQKVYPYILDINDDLYKSVKSECWISQKLSKKNYEKLNKTHKYIQHEYKDKDIEITFTSKNSKHLLVTFKLSDTEHIINKIKIRMFTVNL